MLSKQISKAAILIALCVLATTAVNAQATNATLGGWAARAAQRNTPARTASKTDADQREIAADDTGLQVAAGTGSQDVLERYKEGRRRALIGTWRIHIAESQAGFPAFNAFHTFHEGGTFSEVSDLLPNLGESPAFGVWDLDGGQFVLTFELFAFDENKKQVGIIRVRCKIDVISADQLKGDTIVDFIEPDGTEILNIDSGPITGKRIRPLLLSN